MKTIISTLQYDVAAARYTLVFSSETMARQEQMEEYLKHIGAPDARKDTSVPAARNVARWIVTPDVLVEMAASFCNLSAALGRCHGDITNPAIHHRNTVWWCQHQ